MNGKYVHGDFEFIGEDLQLNRFHFQPVDDADAIFRQKYQEKRLKKLPINF
ncbi:hypothetical protein KHA80_15770 [Anaerobacillus sp. HL2]|nr:hypothetical protein KHA80_15770 [Anaerobacillus sp. HL2]